MADRVSSRLPVWPCLALVATILPLFGGCGGGQKGAVVPPPPSASAVPSGSAPASAAVSPLPIPGPSTMASVAPTPIQVSTVAATKTDASWASCHRGFKAKTKDVAKEVAAMAKACEAVSRMKLLGKTITGSQADSDVPQTFPLEARQGHCYRVYGQAADTIQDLDIVVKDSAGVMVGQDSTDDPSPVVLEDGAVCFHKDDKATIVVSVGMGKGAYAFQVWES